MQKLNIGIPLKECDGKFAIFLPPIPNNVIPTGTFTRIIYTLPTCTLNGIHLLVNFQSLFSVQYFNKYKCSFDPTQHTEIIKKIHNIENDILSRHEFKTKIKTFKISEHMQYGTVKFFSNFPLDKINSEKNMYFVLKMSGVWEDNKYCGVTYKFEHISPPVVEKTPNV